MKVIRKRRILVHQFTVQGPADVHVPFEIKLPANVANVTGIAVTSKLKMLGG